MSTAVEVSSGSSRTRVLTPGRIAGGVGLAAVASLPIALGVRLPFANEPIVGGFALFVAQFALIYAMIGLSVTVVTGYGGMISLMPYSFAGVGAVTTGLVMTNWGWPFWLAVFMAALATLPISVLVGIASVRLKGLYLAIATLTISAALGDTFFKWGAVTGGRTGWTVQKPRLGPIDFSGDLAFYLLCLGTVLLLVWMVEGLRTSRMGRAMLAVKDNQLEAEALGINVYKTKLVAFMLSGMLAGIGGAFLASLIAVVSPSAFQSPLSEVTSILLVTLVVIGGIDRAWGAFFGAIVLVVNQQIAAGAELFFAFLGAYIGLGLILFLLFRPGGLVQVAKIQSDLIRSKETRARGVITTAIGVAVNIVLVVVFLRFS